MATWGRIRIPGKILASEAPASNQVAKASNASKASRGSPSRRKSPRSRSRPRKVPLKASQKSTRQGTTSETSNRRPGKSIQHAVGRRAYTSAYQPTTQNTRESGGGSRVKSTPANRTTRLHRGTHQASSRRLVSSSPTTTSGAPSGRSSSGSPAASSCCHYLHLCK